MSGSIDVITHFGPDADKPEIITALENLTKLHALSVEDLYIKWEQFSNQRRQTHTDLTSKNIDEFKQFLQLQMEKRANQISSSSKVNTSTKKPVIKKSLNSSPLFGLSIPKTPTLKKRKLHGPFSLSDSKQTYNVGSEAETNEKGNSSLKLEFTPGMAEDAVGDSAPLSHAKSSDAKTPGSSTFQTPTTNTPTTSRQNVPAGKILDSLNPENIEISSGNPNVGLLSTEEPSYNQVKVEPFYDAKKYKFRTMRQNLQEASDVLDDQIESFTKIIQNHYKLSPNDFADPTIQSQSEIYAVGRIVPDSPTYDKFLNPESLSLETSRMGGVGRRVRLDLSQVNELSFFLGQIVAFKGKNANGDYFTVNSILPLPYPNSPVSTSQELQEFQANLEGSSLKVIVTCGPYFANDNFSLELLQDFIDSINNEVKPHVLIMFGPFIDITHPLIASGKLPNFPQFKTQPKTLDELFLKLFTPILKTISPHIQTVLIPSTKDAISNHAAYPQASLIRKALQLPKKNFKCMANPSSFQINEIYFGCSNVDTFKDLKEVIKGGTTSSRYRLDRVSEHILQQRRYYPIFPGSIRTRIKPKDVSTKKETNDMESKEEKVYEHISGADLDVSYLGLTEFVGGFSPDIMIIPSELQHFARVVQNVVVINPGRFIRATGNRGSYAQITVQCPDLEDGKLTLVEGEEPVYLHNVWKRARVDLIAS
ncbi:Pol12p [Saccharomyces cerevisiae YJM1573]|nr:Pol12p [Saccharomyces cerevisiae YJM1402]AJP89599.1 Pol12p [Saccharomyces cerevisiae YJM1573]CAD6597768.1 SX2_G0013800.mRNA.1.CDS.1 [Saccharomyces cerevisiae]CAI4250060.1 AAR_G0001600.mRNA.1.CDS.1 [Saccharomyces cerevisiae]CAI4250294.1 BAH_G0001610.mRNA.1.CDS.1 [Saccharomyces cerevisiae]